MMKGSSEMDIDKWLGPKCQYAHEKELCEFYNKMHRDCMYNNSRAIWEWLRNAPCFDEFHSDKFGLWKENNEIVSIARPTSPWLGEAVIDNQSLSNETLYDIIRYCEANFSVEKENSKKDIFLVLLDQNDKLDQLLLKNGYEKVFVDHGTLRYDLENKIEHNTLQNGFSIHRLSEVFDFKQLSKILWLGFHYEGEMPEINDDVQLSIKHAWLNYNRDICSVVLDENGEYASFCGFWYDETTQTAYLEPMVTLDKYHNMGLGKAVVYNSFKILQKKGCKSVFVDPDDKPYDYYLKIGFEHFDYARYYHKSY